MWVQTPGLRSRNFSSSLSRLVWQKEWEKRKRLKSDTQRWGRERKSLFFPVSSFFPPSLTLCSLLGILKVRNGNDVNMKAEKQGKLGDVSPLLLLIIIDFRVMLLLAKWERPEIEGKLNGKRECYLISMKVTQYPLTWRWYLPSFYFLWNWNTVLSLFVLPYTFQVFPSNAHVIIPSNLFCLSSWF